MIVQIIGHNGKGRGSALIKWATRGRFSHVSLRFIFHDQSELQRVNRTIGKYFARTRGKYTGPLTMDHEIESIQGTGVRHQPFIPSKNQTRFNFDHNPEQARLILWNAAKLIGCDYDWRGIGGFLTRRNRQNPTKWFCSELASAALFAVGIVALNMPPHWQSPNVFLASPIFTEERHGR